MSVYKFPVNKPKVVSLFSGCGGLDLGFIRAGYDVVWANDINPDACMTYRENIGDINEGDIYSFDIPDIENLDVLTAGFPCQPFSNAGNRLGVLDLRGKLYEVCLSYAAALRPKIIMFENVRGLISIKNEQGNRLIEEICSRLAALDYEVRFKLIEASQYGVPQRRFRIVIVAIRKALVPEGFSFPNSINEDKLTLGDILNVPDDMPNQNDIIRLNPQALYLGSLVPEGGSWKDIPYEKLPERLQKIRDNMRKYRWPNFYRRFARDEISGTITASFKPENAGVWHPVKDRVFTAREIARIQSFPDDFIFVGNSVKAIYEMIGNAVPPNLSEVFARHFAEILNGQRSNATPFIPYSRLNLERKPIRSSDPEVLFDGLREEMEEPHFEHICLDFEDAEVV